jgi:hypothetical protein
MRLRLLIAATALIAAQPAAAGVRAHYLMGPEPWQRLVVIEVNDHGDGRLDMGEMGVMLVLDGMPYVVDRDAEGPYAARLEDAMADSSDAWAEADGHPPRDPGASPPLPARPPTPPPPQVELIRVGPEIVAGRRGTLWRMRNPGAPAGLQEEEFVVSDDPALAPLNVVHGPRAPGSGEPEPDPDGLLAALRAIHAKGAILRRGQHMRLQRAEVLPIAEAFTLPRRLLSRAALAERRRRTRP